MPGAGRSAGWVVTGMWPALASKVAAGREYQPAGQPEQVNVHDFMDKQLGRAIPHGIYDVAANSGWVSVGTDHYTSCPTPPAPACARRAGLR